MPLPVPIFDLRCHSPAASAIYTGAIFEAVSNDFSGSLGGDGRYDNLVGMFRNK